MNQPDTETEFEASPLFDCQIRGTIGEEERFYGYPVAIGVESFGIAHHVPLVLFVYHGPEAWIIPDMELFEKLARAVEDNAWHAFDSGSQGCLKVWIKKHRGKWSLEEP